MSESSRRIIFAKRRGSNPLNKHRNTYHPNTVSNVTQGVKRSREPDVVEQPPTKKANYKLLQQSNTPPKNLAAQRLQNLRRSLEEKRLQEENKSPVPNKQLTSNNSISHTVTTHSAFVTSTPVRKDASYHSKINLSPLNLNHSLLAQSRLNKYKKVSNNSNSYTSPSCSKDIQVKISGNNSKHIFQINATSCYDSNNSKYSENNIQNDTLEDTMEWIDIDETDIVNNINELRKEMNYDKELPVNELLNTSNEIINCTRNTGVFIVVDTNIFLSQLNFISQLKDRQFTDFGRVTIVVPWMVIQELDYMKESNKQNALNKSARKAVHYINTQLMNKDSYFKGQTVMEASSQDLSSKNPDDGILFCCLQLVEQKKCVILLSNDTNLRNKSLVNKIQAYHSNDLINNLNDLKKSDLPIDTSRRSVQKINILLSNILTYVIEREMENAYGDIWLRMVKTHPPFTTEEALVLMDKYWKSVFSFSLQKQCKQTIEDFILFMQLHRNDESYKLEDFNKFVEYTLSLCIYLKNGYSVHRTMVTDCIKSIQKCTE